MQIKKQLITLGLGALLAQGISPVSAWAQKANQQKSSSGINFSDMDRKIRPQDNFYLYTIIIRSLHPPQKRPTVGRQRNLLWVVSTTYRGSQRRPTVGFILPPQEQG